MSGTVAELLVVVLEEGRSSTRQKRNIEGLETLLRVLDWRAHLFVVGGGGEGSLDATLAVAETVAGHLRRYPLAAIHLHPLLRVANDGSERLWIAGLLEEARPFQEEAFRERSEPRLGLHPLLLLQEATPLERLAAAARFLVSRAAAPAVVVAQERLDEAKGVLGALGVRTYVATGTGCDAVARQVWAGHVVESALASLDRPAGDVLAPCRPHFVLDAGSDWLYPCLMAWQRRGPVVEPSRTRGASAGLAGDLAARWCPGCVAGCALSAEASLLASARAKEGHRLCLTVATELVARGEPAEAAPVAAAAARLAGDDAGRAAGALLAGLAHLGAGELQEADDALLVALRAGQDPGVVAFHRGRVQMAWRDWIEAGERFAEALAVPASSMPAADIRYEMALCHINLEEYPEAEEHLEVTWEERHEAPVAFYRGVCALGTGRADVALERIEQALELGPTPEDRGRVLLYRGLALRELGRWDETIATLRQAAAADPEDTAALHQLGFCLYKTGRHEEAVQCFLEIVTGDPSSALDWANLGSNLRELGQRGEAIAAYRQALALDPTIGFARTSLARLEGDAGDQGGVAEE